MPNLVNKESQCEICHAAIPDTDIICVNCSANNAIEQYSGTDEHVDKGTIKFLNENSDLAEEAADDDEGCTSSPSHHPVPDNPKHKVDYSTEHSPSSASSSMPWHGGTLVPPPPPAICSLDEAHNDLEAMSKKKRVSGYTLWTSSHKEQIKNHMAPGTVGIRAFGAAAGQLWKSAEPQVKAYYKDMASKLAQPNPEEALEHVVGSTPPVAPSALPAHAGPASIDPPRRSRDTAPDRPAPLQQLTPRAPVRSARRSTLDMSEDDNEPEPGWEELQTPTQMRPRHTGRSRLNGSAVSKL